MMGEAMRRAPRGRLWRTGRSALLALVGVVLLLPQPAFAHGDARLMDEVVLLGPGQSVDFESGLHYHRLVGEFAADGEVAVRLVGVDGTPRVVVTGVDIAVNELVRCCDEQVWTPHRLVIENLGDRPVTVDGRAMLVHDDLAVMVDRAESGTAESVVVMGGIWAYVLFRIRRKGALVKTVRPGLTLFIVVAAVLGVGVYGAVRYQSASAPGVVAGLADVPILPVNPLVSRASLLMGVAMIGWAVAGAGWARAARVTRRPVWAALGAGLVGSVIVTAIAIGTSYGAWGMPLAMALAAVVPMLVFGVMEWRSTETFDDPGVQPSVAMAPN